MARSYPEEEWTTERKRLQRSMFQHRYLLKYLLLGWRLPCIFPATTEDIQLLADEYLISNDLVKPVTEMLVKESDNKLLGHTEVLLTLTRRVVEHTENPVRAALEVAQCFYRRRKRATRLQHTFFNGE